MKTYKAVLVEFVDEDGSIFTSEAMDLVNIEDEFDRIFADPDSFFVDELVTEDQIYTEMASYVDDQSAGSALFAFKKEQS